MTNMLARQRTDLFAGVYSGTHRYPADNLLDPTDGVRVPDRQHFLSQQRKVIEQLDQDDLI